MVFKLRLQSAAGAEELCIFWGCGVTTPGVEPGLSLQSAAEAEELCIFWGEMLWHDHTRSRTWVVAATTRRPNH